MILTLIVWLLLPAVLSVDDSERHVCKREKPDPYDDTKYHIFNSPDIIYPIKYKLGVKLGSKYTDGEFLGIIRNDSPNWDVINWHMSHYVNKPEYMHCVDAGGNFGFFSLHMAGWGCKVSTFDIQPAMTEVELYQSYVNSFHHSQMHVYRVGLSDKPSVMRFENEEGYAFLAPGGGSSSTSAGAGVDVPVMTGDLCLHKRKMALVKIDVEGFEVRTVNGMRSLISEGLIEGFHIEIGPARWDRANLTTQAGVDMLMDNLSKKYHVNLILRNSDTCVSKIFSGFESKITNKYTLTNGNNLVPIDWSDFSTLMHNMVKFENDCNFYFSPWTVPEAIAEQPLFKHRFAALEGKVVIGNKGMFY